MRRCFAALVVTAALASCRKAPPPSAAVAERAAAPSPGAPQVDSLLPPPSTAAPVADQQSRESAFLVLQEDTQAIVLESSLKPGSSVLVEHADDAVYQADLGLLWYRDQNRLYVLDLDGLRGASLTTKPVLIASGLPDDADQLSIARGSSLAEDDTGCESSSIKLRWAKPPTIRAFLTEAPELRLENARWLEEQLGRALRPVGQRKDFSNVRERRRLPRKLQACVDKRACGASLPFGMRGWELVLAVERPGGDCIQRACLLHDPRTSRFAAPPEGKDWGAPRKSALGSCGPYRFDRAQLRYLADARLCVPETGCRAIDGSALGWLVPGDTVGAPGNDPAEDEGEIAD